MAIKLPLERGQNTIRAALPEAYLKLLDIEIAANSGNIRLPFYCYHDEQARHEPNALPVKQGVEMVTADDFAGAFLAELDAIRAAEGDTRTDAEKLREAHYKAGYSLLKSRGFSGVDC